MIRWLAPALFALALGAVVGLFSRNAAEAIDVDMKPAACYSHIGERPVDIKHGYAGWGLVFNTCSAGYRWVKIPLAPDSEV